MAFLVQSFAAESGRYFYLVVANFELRIVSTHRRLFDLVPSAGGQRVC